MDHKTLKLFCLSGILITGCAEHKVDQQQKTNFIIIQADDMGFSDLGIHGNQYIETEHLDSFAQKSVQFANYYVNPVCAPTRASLMTGRHFLRTGVSHVHGGKEFINLNETTIAEIFADNGYETAMWGKWHSGKTNGYFPWQRGFNEAYMAKLYDHHDNTGRMNGEKLQTQGWMDKVIVDFAIDFIRRNKEKPFLAYLSFLTCHAPLDAPQDYIEKYTAKGLSKNLSTLYAMVDHMDDQLGRFFNEIDKMGLSDNTMILFMSDNGPAVLNNDLTDTDRDIRYINNFRGHKGNIWENGVKSPLFIYYGNHLQPGVIDPVVDVTDILPTLAAIAGIEIPDDNLPIDGLSFSNLLYNGHNRSKAKYSFNYAAKGWQPTDRPWSPVGLKGEYDPVMKPLVFSEMHLSVRHENYKLILNPGQTGKGPALDKEDFVLFDIDNDPEEKNNIIDENPDEAKALKQVLKKWFKSIVNDEGAFKMPTFIIEDNSTVLGYGPVKISENLQNTCFYLGGWKEKDDYAMYAIDVKKPGIYQVGIECDMPDNVDIGIRLLTKIDTVDLILPLSQKQDRNMKMEKGMDTLILRLNNPLPRHTASFELKSLRFLSLDNVQH